MRYAQIRKMDISNGEGCGIAIFSQGCPIRCQGCHNSSIWGFDSGKEWNQESKQTVLQLLDRPQITRLSILGGEPLLKQNIQDIAQLCMTVKWDWPQKKIWLWSGYLWEDIYSLAFDKDYKSLPHQEEWTQQEKDALKNIIFNIDILVDGPFVQEKRDITLKWRGSKNQRVIDMHKTLSQTLPILPAPAPILYCD